MKVLFVCAGNICRPMAEGIFRKLLRERNLERQFAVDSAGTGGGHAGQGANRRTAHVLEKHGAGFPHAARQVRDSDASFDLILAADNRNLRDLGYALPQAKHKTRLILGDREVPDPFYGDLDDFEGVYAMLEPALNDLLDDHENR
jgi:protein-tyrosine phosphatase